MIFAFGDCELDEERSELRRLGHKVALQPKVLELLLHLIQQRERVVSKRELLDALWPGLAVTDSSIERAVSLARGAIGRKGGAIVTVPRRGYRFQATVRALRRADEEPAPASRYIGRSALLAWADAHLDAALAGRGRILLLVGEAGIGKTRTAELLADGARRAGALVASALRLEEGAPTYWEWTRVLRALTDALPRTWSGLSRAHRRSLATLLPELPAASGAKLAVPHDGEGGRIRLFEAVQQLLARAAAVRPLALLLDDLHGAGSESLALLEFIGQSLATLPIVIVATSREEAALRRPQAVRAWERLLRSSSLERWPLAGLTSAEVGDFVRSRLGQESEPALVAALERKAGGNPLLLAESLRSLEARGLLGEARDVAGWEALLPRGIQHLIDPKLRQLTAGARVLLRAAAALGVELDQGLLARCVDDASRIESEHCELEDAGLLFAVASSPPRLRFGHVLVREALYAELVPAGLARQVLHARIHAALETTGATELSFAERAHHACEAAPRVAPQRASELAREAGEHALRLRDFERAADWFARACEVLELDATAEPDLKATLWIAHGTAQASALGIEQARRSYHVAADHARASGNADLLAKAALGFAHRPDASGHGEPDAIALLEEALRGPVAPALAIRLQSRLAAELRYADPKRAARLAQEAASAARALGDPAVLAQALDDSAYTQWGHADPEEWVELNGEIAQAARTANDLELELSGRTGRVTGFLELGDIVSVDREMRGCERTAEASRTPYARWLCVALRAMRALLDGDLEAAEQNISESIRLGERVDSPVVALQLQLQLVYLRFEQGRLSEIEAVVRAQVVRYPDAPHWRAGFARVLSAIGRLTEARLELDRLAIQHFEDVPRDRGWLPTLAFASEVAAATRDLRSAALLEERLAPYARLGVVAGNGLLYCGSVSHYLGLLALARENFDAAVAHFEAALAVDARAGARVWEARTCIALGRALFERDAAGDRARAVTLVTGVVESARARGWVELAANSQAFAAELFTRRSGGAAARTRSRASES